MSRPARLAAVALAISLCGAIHCLEPSEPVAQPSAGLRSAATSPTQDAAAQEVQDATVEATSPPEAEAPVAARMPCDPTLLYCPPVMCPDSSQGAVLHGTVRDPAGKVPVAHALVYVMDTRRPLPPLVTGVSSCMACPVPITGYLPLAQTRVDGTFQLTAVPTGKNIPLVIVAGKWRRQVSLDEVVPCTDTAVDPELTRLPRNQMEGDMPQMAVLTSGCDDMACFLRRVGVDAAEFTAPHAGGRVDVYRGVGGGDLDGDAGERAGDCTSLDCPLWSTTANLQTYDDVLLGCECDGNNQTKSLAAFEAVHDWLGVGGNLIATHSQATWLENGLPDLKQLAAWTYGPSAGAPGPFRVSTSFQQSAQLLQFLEDLDATTPIGTLNLRPAQVSTSMSSAASPAWSWVTAGAADVLVDGSPQPTEGPKLISAGTPVGGIGDSSPAVTCGNVVVSDIHVSGHGAPGPASVPGGCTAAALSPGELALEYMLFSFPALCFEPETLPWPPTLLPAPPE